MATHTAWRSGFSKKARKHDVPNYKKIHFHYKLEAKRTVKEAFRPTDGNNEGLLIQQQNIIKKPN